MITTNRQAWQGWTTYSCILFGVFVYRNYGLVALESGNNLVWYLVTVSLVLLIQWPINYLIQSEWKQISDLLLNTKENRPIDYRWEVSGETVRTVQVEHSIINAKPSKGTGQCPQRTDEKKLQIFEERRFLAFDFMSHELPNPSDDEDNQRETKDVDMIFLHDDQCDHNEEK